MASSGHNSTAHSNTPSATRGKSDPAWDHVTEGRAPDGKKTLTCLYCGKTIKGGGINRMKQHLAGKSGEVGPCKKVPGDVRYRMEEALKAIIEKNKRSEESNPFGRAVFEFEDDAEIEEIIPQHNKGILINEGGGSRNKSKATMTQRGTGSSSGCERNWSVFERIHTKKRNRLEHQRLNDLVYIHYNLRLKNRHFNNMKNYDPVDIESIDKTEFWIVEDEEEPPLLDFDELEQMLHQENPAPQNKRQCHGLRDEDNEDDVVLEVEDDIDLGSFGDVNMDDRSNAQSGGVGTSNNENEDDDAWLMEGLPRN